MAPSNIVPTGDQMSLYAQRQFSLTVAAGSVTELSAAPKPVYQMTDVHPKYVLKLADGKANGDTASIAAGGSFSLPLPSDYASSKRLFVALRATGIVKATVVSPDHPTSDVMVRPPYLSSEGIFSFVGTVTSITINNPTIAEVRLQWFLFEYPDLALADSWRDGGRALGINQ